MPAADSRLTELGKLKNKILEAEIQLKEEKKIANKLRENSEKKIHQLSVTDDAITAEMESFRWKKEQILFSKDSFEEETFQKLTSLRREEQEIREAIAMYDIVEMENEKLNLKLKEVSTSYLSNSKQQAAEREMKKQKNFDTRMQMEEMLRKTIKNFDRNYQHDAISKMEQEALMANAENKKIHAEFELREERTENLIRQQQQSYDALMTIHIERDVLAVSTSMQEKYIKNIVTQNEADELELKRLQEEIVMLKSDIAELRDLNVYKKNLTKDVGFINQEVKRVKKINQQLREETIGLCQDLLKVGQHIANKGRSHQSTLIAARIGKLSQSDVIESSPSVGGGSVEEEGLDTFLEGDAGDLPLPLHTTITTEPPAGSEVWEPLHSVQPPYSPSPNSPADPRLRHSHSASSGIAARTDPDDIWRSDGNRNAVKHSITAQVGRRQKIQANTSKTGNSISSFYTIQKSEGFNRTPRLHPESSSQVEGIALSGSEVKLPQLSSSFSMMY